MIWPWLAAAGVVWWAEAVIVLAAEYRRPARAAAWLLVLLALPVVGIVPFLLARGKAGRGDEGRRNGQSGRDGRAGRSGPGGPDGRGDDGDRAGRSEPGGPDGMGDDGEHAGRSEPGGSDGRDGDGGRAGLSGPGGPDGRDGDGGRAGRSKPGGPEDRDDGGVRAMQSGSGTSDDRGGWGGESAARGTEKRSAPAADGAFPDDERLRRTLLNMSNAPITGCNGTEILTDGEAAFSSIFDMIDKAGHHIHLAYYILRDDGVGRRFRDALIRKAREGVQVRLLYDGFGSWKLKRSYLRELAEGGVRVQCFLPLGAALRSRRINHRYHRKIVVVDGKSGFTGGINIGDEYLGMDRKIGYWRDTHLRVEGDAVYDLQNIFVRDWELASGERLEDPAFWPPHACASNERVQIVSCGPRLGRNEILDALLAAIAAARERVWIATPYFVPDDGLKTALQTAALGGVDVRLIVPGVADTRFVLAASLSHAADLREAGARVYRYQKGFIHAKVMLVDRLLASVGTANLDMRSFYSNYELNALLFDGKPIGRLEEDFLRDFADSREATAEELRGRTAGARAGRAAARLLTPLL